MEDVTTTKKIFDRLESLTTGQAIILQRMDSLTAFVERHERTLNGNGKEGLVSRFTRLEADCEVCPIREVAPAILGGIDREGMSSRVKKIEEMAQENAKALHGTKDSPGLVDDVRELKKSLDTFMKVFWLVMATAITGVVGYLVDIWIIK